MQQEKYRSLFENRCKSFRLIKLIDKDGKPYKMNCRITQFANTVIFPFTDDMEDIEKALKYIFGSVQYKKYVKQYFFPRKFTYKRTVIPSPMIRETIDGEAIRTYLKSVMPDLAKNANFRMLNKRNVLVDYSSVIKALKYKPEFLSKPAVLSKIELLIPEILTYILMDNEDINVDSYSHTLGLYLFAASAPRAFPGFNRILIPYRITTTDSSVLRKDFMNSTQNLKRSVKLDENKVYDISLIRFLLRCVGRDYFDKSYEIYNQWIDKFIQLNPVFFFYTDKVGFIFDMRELELIQKKKYDTILRLLRQRLLTLIQVNNTELDDDSLDKHIAEIENIEANEMGVKTTTVVQNKDEKIAKTETNLNPDVKREIKARVSKLVSQIANDSTKINLLKSSLDDSSVDEIFEDSKQSDDEMIEEDPEITSDDVILEDEEVIEEDENEEPSDVNLDDEEETKPTAQPIEKEEEVNEKNKEIKDKETVEEGEITEQQLEDVLKVIDKTTKPTKTPKQLKRIKLISQKYKSIKLNDGRTLEEIMDDVKSSTIDNQIKEVPLRNKSLLKSNLVDFEKSYVEKQYEQDIVKVIKSFSENKEINLHITDMKKEDTSDQFNYRESYTVKFEDDNQKRHTLHFDLPKVNDQGVIKINGNEKVLRKQMIFLPVVKNSPTTVWLTSYLNRTVLERYGNVNNRSTHILKKLILEYLKSSPNATVKYGNCVNDNRNKYLTTIEFDELAEKYESIILNNKTTKKPMIKIFFIIDECLAEVEKTAKLKAHLAHLKKDNILPVGVNYDTGEVYFIDVNDKKGSVSELIINLIASTNIIPNIADIIKSIKVPNKKTFIKIKLQSKDVPLIVFLSALFGFTNVLNTADIKVTVTEKAIKGDRRNVIKFKNCYLYYDSYPAYKAFLLNGLYYLPTEEFELAELESQMVYLDYLWGKFKSRNVIKGWYSFKELFLDPTTIQILKDFNQPTDFLELFLYAASLLDDNEYKHEGDKDNYRIRGYETMVECLYTALAEQYINIKQHKRASFTVPPDVVFNKLHKSQILANKDTLNPMQEIKDKGTVTMKGPSGTNLKQAYTMIKRGYDTKSIQIFAMSTVDNSNTGVIKQLCMDPNIRSTRGYMNTGEDKSKTTFAQLYSYEEGVVPNIERDDPSRNNFATIQTSHLEESHGSQPPIVRTGVESILAYKIPETFVKRAKQDGVVAEVDEKTNKIYVIYKDGSKDVIEYGMHLNRNSNFFVENDLQCRVKKGSKLKAGDIVAFNKGWFVDEGDNVVYKSGPLARLVMLENESTEEDSSIISEGLSKKMESGVVKKKAITLRKNTLVHNYLKKGDHVLIGDPLMGFEENESSDTAKVMDLFGLDEDEFSNDLLRKTPKANGTGVIRDVKIYWTVDPSEMHPSLAKLVNNYIREIKKSANENEKYTGKIDESKYEAEISVPNRGRINGEVMPEDGGVLVEYYIAHDSGLSSGDKISYNSALKSVISKVVPDEFQARTASGIKVDCLIGVLSAQARMINSIYINGILGAYLYRASMKYSDEYLKAIGEKK